jgi:hypothetical protein
VVGAGVVELEVVVEVVVGVSEVVVAVMWVGAVVVEVTVGVVEEAVAQI